jgi:hypothetical protein
MHAVFYCDTTIRLDDRAALKGRRRSFIAAAIGFP